MFQSDQPPHRTVCAILVGLMVANIALAQGGQVSQVSNPGVQQRMATMNAANAALTSLSDMMGGRALFDKDRALAARKALIAETGRITAVFRQPHTDPLSRARPVIWSRWGDFRSRARATHRAARRLRTSSLATLRQTLPRQVAACLNCHRAYRSP